MAAKEIALAFAANRQAADGEGLSALCTDDFHFSGPVPLPLGLSETIEWISVLKHAAPDIDYHHAYVQFENGHIVHLVTQVTGTHTGDLDLTDFSMGIIPPTGKSFSMPLENAQVTIRDEKVTRYHVDPRPDAGILGLLAALGITGAIA
jgi:hypothetical protein